MNYFGRLEKIDLPSKNEEERLKLFLKRRLFEKINVISLSPNLRTELSKENSKPKFGPKKALIADFYNYLLEIYREDIEEECILYLSPYNEITFGLENQEKIKVARYYYRHIATEIIEKGIKMVRYDVEKKGTDRVARATLLEQCEIKQNTLKNRVISENRVGLDHYLMGRGSYFTPVLPYQIPILSEIIQFEGALQSILALNHDFSLEEDTFFDKNATPESPGLDTITKTLMKKVKRKRMPTDEEAKEYLIDTLFRSKD